MSLKENIDAIKKEISTEEKMLEGVIKAEGFWRKYKIYIISIAVVLIGSFIAFKGYEFYKEQRAISASNIYTQLIEGGDVALEQSLKSENPRLYNLYLFQKAINQNDTSLLKKFESNNEFLNSIATYQISSIEGDLGSIQKYSSNNGAVLRDFASLQEAYLLFIDGKNDEAKRVLGMISFDSPLKNVADLLLHFSAKGAK